MGERPAAGLPAPLRVWLDTDRQSTSDADRLRAIEDLIAYWVPISTERDLRLDAVERRLAALEAAAVPDRFPCVVDLADRVATLEATVWELRRRLGMS